MKTSRGFTLIELLVVISIIALLSSIVLASLSAARDNARMGAAKQFAAQSARLAGDEAVGIWDFEEGSGTVVSDRSGFGNNGTLSSAGWSTDTPSGSGSSGNFNGSRRVTIPYSDSLQPKQGITVAAWFKPTTISGQRRIISSTQSGGWSIVLNENSQCPNDTFCGLIYIGGGYKNVSIPVDRVRPDVWQHAVMTYDGSTLRLYLDGLLVMSKNQTGAIGYGVQNPVCIGGEATESSCGNNFSGLIDEVRVYSKGLTASEVGKVYAEGVRRLRFADHNI